MVENDNSSESIKSELHNDMDIPRWVYSLAMFIVILVMFILLFQHDFNGAIIALFATVVLIYSVQNQQIEYLTKRLNDAENRTKSS